MTSPILVTGAAGFIGARFVEACNQRGLDIISVDKLAYFDGRLEHSGLDFGRIVDHEDLLVQLEELAPGAIVHLGACTDTTEMDVDYLTAINLEYSKSLWTHATGRQLPMVYASSAATYGGGEHGYDDDEALIEKLHPLNPYGESKRLFDLWVLEEERAGRKPSVWSGFKFFNVYGYGERHKGAMSSVVVQAFDQIRDTGTVRLFQSHREGIEHGNQARDFIFVEDLISVLFFALESPIDRGIYNLGTGRARTFVDLVRATFSAMGAVEKIDFIPTPEHLRERYQYFTEAKMERLRAAGYKQPFTSLEDGVSRYVERLLGDVSGTEA